MGLYLQVQPKHRPARASGSMLRSSPATLVLLSEDSASTPLQWRSQFSDRTLLSQCSPSWSWILQPSGHSGRSSLYSKYKGHTEDRQEDRSPDTHFEQIT